MAGATGGFVAGSVIGKLLLDKTGWDQSVKAVKKDMGEFGKKAKELGDQFNEMGQRFQSVGKQGMIAGAAILGGLGIAVKGFADFDAAMTESLAIMGDLSDSLRDDLVGAAKQVAKDTTFSATEAAKAFYFLASAGYDASESVKTLPVVAKFAQAGMFGLERATSLLADAQSALGMRIRDDAVANMQNMIRVSDVLTKANIMANASVEQFSEALTTRAGAALRMVNKDVEEGAAVLAAFADQGIKGAEAGTRLDIVLRDLQTKAIENAKVFKAFGVSVFDSNGNMNNMADIMADMESLFAGMSAEQKRATLMQMEFSDRSVASILSLVGMSGAIRDYEKGLRNAGGVTEEVAKKQLETLNATLKILKNNMVILFMEIGEKLAPTIKAFAEKVEKLASKITDWMDKHPFLTKAITMTAAALGSLLLIGGTTVFMLGSFLRSVGAIIKALPLFRAGLIALKGQMAALKAPLNLSSGLLTKIGMVGAAAFVGWNIGKLIGELTGLNKVIENASSKIIDKFGLWKGSAELVASSTERVAKQQDILKQATEKCGVEVSNYIIATKILNGTMEVQNGHFVRVSKSTKNVADETGGLKDEIDGLLPPLDDVIEKQKTWGEYLEEYGVIPLKEKVAKISELLGHEEKLGRMLRDGVIDLTEYGDGVRAINDELKELGATTVTQVLPPARDFTAALDQAIPRMYSVVYAAGDFEAQLKAVGDQMGVSANTILRELWNIRVEFLRMMGIVVGKWEDFSDAAKTAGGEVKGFMQDVSTVVSDAMREIARSIAGLIDFKKLFGAAAKDIKFDASPFNALVDAAKKAYDKIRGLADSEYDAQERRITRAQEDEDRKYKHKYDLEVKSIRNSSMNEKQKQAAIEALDIKYETARIARERKREDEKYAREEAQKVKLLKLEWDHQAELDKIKKAEDTARQKLADDEEKRQNSLWFKVKGIFATTCEELATMWLTKFVMQTIGDTVVDLFAGFFKKAAKKGGEIMGEVATEAVSNAGDIVKGASGAISGLWTGLGAAVGSFLGTWLAGLGGPSGHQQQQQINDTKDSRNFLADLNNFMLGTVKPWFATTDKALGGYFEKFDGLKGSVDDTRTAMVTRLDASNRWFKKISDTLGNLKSAARGATITSTELVAVHGRPSVPEYIIPAPDLRSMMMSTKPGPGGDKKRRDILIQTTVNLNGIMVTPREFVRGQLLREIESAVKSGIRKSELQAALGV